VEPPRADHEPHVPGPSPWPVGFAIGIAVLLTGLIVSWIVVAIGAVIAALFAVLWIRDAARELRGDVPEIEPERREVLREAAAESPAEGEPALPVMSDAEIDRFPRNVFLEGATLGIGAVIGGLVTLPVIGFAVAPAFLDQPETDVDLGPLENFPEGKFVITTFLQHPEKGEVSRRTNYIRNNGLRDGVPSFTVISNRCVHLGCPVQPNGPIEEANKKEVETEVGHVTLIPATPAGFGCPCHGGQYDIEGNRTAGPPVRALDRFQFSVRNGNLWLESPFSVAFVEGTGADAEIHKYKLAGPGEHIDDWEAILYPIQAPSN
jgi:quinol---cytochrome c reductase iron-sulfur subunit, bacillus type